MLRQSGVRERFESGAPASRSGRDNASCPARPRRTGPSGADRLDELRLAFQRQPMSRGHARHGEVRAGRASARPGDCRRCRRSGRRRRRRTAPAATGGRHRAPRAQAISASPFRYHAQAGQKPRASNACTSTSKSAGGQSAGSGRRGAVHGAEPPTIARDHRVRLARVLPAWSAPLEALHLYFPSRRHPSPALRASIAFLTGDPFLSSAGAMARFEA